MPQAIGGCLAGSTLRSFRGTLHGPSIGLTCIGRLLTAVVGKVGPAVKAPCFRRGAGRIAVAGTVSIALGVSRRRHRGAASVS